ncbi:MAG: SRPBCC domain-containing protein [Terriglobales bacterium]
MAAIITPNQDAVVSEIEVAAPPARVFQALIDPQQVMQWWTGGECQIESFAMDARPGGRWSYNTKQSKRTFNGVSKFYCDGEVLEFDPPRVLAYTWIANWHDNPAERTVVRWELAPTAGGTKVKVTHSGLSKMPAARKDYSGGWVGVMAQLKKFIEN